MFDRALNLRALSEKHSFFLLGPRQTGKSTLLRSTFPDAVYIDLLDTSVFRAFAASPERLGEQIRAVRGSTPVVIVDEIQKLPELLDEVHRLMERDRSLRFVLTGSSARRLRERGRNLLGGRAHLVRLHPIASTELRDADRQRSWTDLLSWGGLPSVLTSDSPRADLEAYVGLYLQEEIRAEGLVRSLPNFSRFLTTAAATNGEILNFTKLGNDAQLSPRTVRDYYQILEDTLVGELVPPFQGTQSRKAVATSKFYFFDVGVTHALLDRWSISPRTTEYGRALEHLIQRELRAAIDYSRDGRHLYFWRSRSQLEVDFVLTEGTQPRVAIEVKATQTVSTRDLTGLRAFGEDWPGVRKIVVCLEATPRTTDAGVEILPVDTFLTRLWAAQI